MNLIGKKYPIKNENDEVVGYKTIKSMKHCENAAAVVITLKEDQDGVIFVPYSLAFDLDKNQYNGPDVSFD